MADVVFPKLRRCIIPVLLCLLPGAGRAFVQQVDAPLTAPRPKSVLPTGEELDRLKRQVEEIYPRAIQLHQTGIPEKRQEAIRLMKQSYGLVKQVFPEDHYPQGHGLLAEHLAWLAIMLNAQGEDDEARPYYHQTVAMYRRLLAKGEYPEANLANLAQSLTNLGHFSLEQNDFETAQRSFEESLEHYRLRYPPDQYPHGHANLARTYNYLGIVQESQNDYTSAREYYERAYEMHQQLVPPEKYPNGHYLLTVSLGNIGNLIEKQEQYAEAREYIQLQLEMLRRLYPQGHSDLARCLRSMGYLLTKLQHPEAGRRYLEESKDAFERLYPPERYPQGHPELAESLGFLGRVSSEQRRYDEAVRFLEQSLEMYQRLYPATEFPRGHRTLANLLDELGKLSLLQLNYDTAQQYYERAYEMNLKLYPAERFPEGHPTHASSLLALGSLFGDKKDYAKARSYLEQALAMQRNLYSADSSPDSVNLIIVSLSHLGGILQDQGEYTTARQLLEESLKVAREMFSEEEYPNGHQNLNGAINNLGVLYKDQGNYDEARKLFEESLTMVRKLYPAERYPKGHPQIAHALNNLGFIMAQLDKFEAGRDYYEQGLAMRQRLFAAEQYPEGHPDLANSLDNLGHLLKQHGDYSTARPYVEQALTMYQALYPPDRFPKGHPDLAIALSSMGNLKSVLGDRQAARDYVQQSLTMRRALFGEVHPAVAQSLLDLANSEFFNRDYENARKYVEEALEMQQKLYPPEAYPSGHPHLSDALYQLAGTYMSQGAYEEALKYTQRAIEMDQQIYPAGAFPHGTPGLASCLGRKGYILWGMGRPEEARVNYERALQIQRDLVVYHLSDVSEAEALNYYQSQLTVPIKILLSLWLELDESNDDLYTQILLSKGFLHGIVRPRRELFEQITDPLLAEKYQQYVGIRRRLGSLTLAPAVADSDSATLRFKQLQDLTARKEQLERELLRSLPDERDPFEFLNVTAQDLQQQMPPQTAFIDYVYYQKYQKDPRVKRNEKISTRMMYAAFVLQPGRDILRVELGSANSIDRAVSQWRESIIAGKDDPAAAAKLRTQLWEPIEELLADNTTTIYFSPDAALTRLPWAALPGRREGSFLLEDYSLAVIPHGHFLWDQLRKQFVPSDTNTVLAVGSVSYDEGPEAAIASTQGFRSAERGDQELTWQPLPGTENELISLAERAGDRPFRKLSGRDASTRRVLAALPEARWAHIATHGFFADPKLRSVLQVDEDLFEQQMSIGFKNRSTVAGRNPLVLSGLVLAGANQQQSVSDSETAGGDGGILTAEAIASVDLSHLELAVLSACETGLGEVAGGEGVFGLQRAFHLAGARNVVASLWKVDDQATAALMNLFYQKLWTEDLSPAEALRAAQIAILRNPDRIPRLAASRGASFAEEVKLVSVERRAPSADRKTTPIRQWAAFVLSGVGR